MSTLRLDKAILLSLTLHGLLMFGLIPAIDALPARAPARKAMQVQIVRHEAAASGEIRGPAGKSTPRPNVGGRPVAISGAAPRAPAAAIASGASGLSAPEVAGPALDAAGNPAAMDRRADVHDGFDNEDLRQYMLAIAIKAGGFKRYPALAVERGWQGAVEVAVSLLPETPWPAIALAKSSGYPELDEHAVDMIRRASREIPIPAGLREHSIRFVRRIEFDPKD